MKPWAAVLAATLGLCAPAWAADHLDGPAVKTDPATDINDVYAWMSTDGAKVYLVMTVFPLANTSSKFSDKALYVFHVKSKASFVAPGGTDVNVICKFDTAQTVQCWAGGEYVAGNANNAAGIANASGKLKVFAGLRDDPFFFNLDGFNDVTKFVQAAATGGGLPAPDANGCYPLDSGTQTTIKTKLKSNPDADAGATARNFFAGLNTLAIAIAVDKTVLTGGGPVLGVWGSTNKVKP